MRSISPAARSRREPQVDAEQQGAATERRDDRRRRAAAELLEDLVGERRGPGQEGRLPEMRAVGDVRPGTGECPAGRLAGRGPWTRHGHDARAMGTRLEQLAGEASAGTNSRRPEPGPRRVAANDAPALPDESTTTSRTPWERSQDTVTAVPRSLNDPVGSPPSSLATIPTPRSTSAVLGSPSTTGSTRGQPAAIAPDAAGPVVHQGGRVRGRQLELERRAARGTPPVHRPRRSGTTRAAAQLAHEAAAPTR